MKPAPSEKVAVGIDNVVKIYGEGAATVTALNRVSLEIDDNEFFTLLGPSGCGKTTILRCIAGFEQVNDGHILLFGNEIDELPPNRRPVNTVFQHYALFPHMTVAANVGFGLKMLKRPANEVAEVVLRVLRLVHMDHLADRRPVQLSGGQQQRVALARALASQPKVLLLDEPLSALDLKLRQEMRMELKQLQEETGITFIFVTHDQEEALTMSDRIAVMSEGEIQQIGRPTDIYERPVNHFVADFIGETNFFDVTVESIEHDRAVCVLPGGARVMVEAVKGCKPGDSVSLSVRPEKIRLRPSGNGGRPDDDGQLAGQIARPIYLGTDTHYRVQLPGDLSIVVRVQNAHEHAAPVRVGDAVVLAFDPGSVVMLRD